MDGTRIASNETEVRFLSFILFNFPIRYCKMDISNLKGDL